MKKANNLKTEQKSKAPWVHGPTPSPPHYNNTSIITYINTDHQIIMNMYYHCT